MSGFPFSMREHSRIAASPSMAKRDAEIDNPFSPRAREPEGRLINLIAGAAAMALAAALVVVFWRIL